MSGSADKKREYAERARSSLAEDPPDFAGAFKYTCRAAKHSLDLAEQQNEKARRASIEEAKKFMAEAAKLKKKTQALPEEDDDEKVEEASQWKLTRKPKVQWEDVKGLYEAKEMVLDCVINPMKFPELAEELKVDSGGGLLLYGPPGNGKTMFAKALANEIDAVFLNVSAADLKNKYVGQSEKNVAGMFAEARKHSRCVLFIDEAESVLSKRGKQKISTVEQFLAESDGVKETRKDQCLLILLATNRPWNIDNAVMRPGRIGVHVYVGLPVEEARKSIIEAQPRVPLGEDFKLEELVEKTESFTCSEIVAVCEGARYEAFRRATKTQGEAEKDPGQPRPIVSWDDFETAFKKITPYSQRNKAEMKEFEDWKGAEDSDDEHAPDDDNED